MSTLLIADQELKVAVVGCGHGQLDTIYSTLEVECAAKGWALSDLDFLIICGDFQAIRNNLDLNCMSVPRRYLKLGDFHKYYSRASLAPVLTLVIGGNHEASNYLFELYHGGWLAPNIYYLGAAGVVRYGPWRIAGLSGIYHAPDYLKPHDERLPYDRGDIRSVYHVREYDVQRLLHVNSPVDIAVSHDWPAWVELFGDHGDLFSKKPHFLTSALADRLGSKPATQLLSHLRPSYWFSGHMHVRFAATVELQADDLRVEDAALRSEENVPENLRPVLSRSASSKAASKKALRNTGTASKTEFLGLDKVGSPTFQWLDIRSLAHPRLAHVDKNLLQRGVGGNFHLCYDEEWLAITRACVPALRVADPEALVVGTLGARNDAKMPSAASVDMEMEWIKQNIVDKGLLRIPMNFVPHAPVHDPTASYDPYLQPLEFPNQQTAEFCELLEIPNKFALACGSKVEDDGMVEFAED
ncbi:lariat debranching enzyme, C-terminal domain-containing protein [Apodospora peruviana]|uniref:Lariat debranching enzyme, C-terminal domain-containing protein n=1 Tax=Apodospora peruviana TaxID=516989 RepID=A0AAE0HW64_9PEZI|nr:lariat debranching enzyme, C-terminal domain-containing protein [Apodospora peruviana]